MPRKKKKKITEEDITMLDFELSFDDVTMVEAEGYFDRVQKLMKEEEHKTFVISNGVMCESPVKESVHSNDVWTIKTRLTIFSRSFGQCDMFLDFNSDKSIYILKFSPSVPDMYTNPDIRCLARWASMAGWKIPQPHPELVRSNMVFWKHMWEVMLVDSDFLDNKYGIRKCLDMTLPPEENDDF